MTRTVAATRVAGRGLLFHGSTTTDSLVVTGSSVLGDEALKSIACWLNLTSTNSGAARIMRRNAFTVRFSSTNLDVFQSATGTGTWGINSTQYPALGTWFHLAITYDRSGGTPLAAVPIFYINGAVATQIAPTQPTGTITADGANNWCIGNANAGGTTSVDGSMAMPYIYERILTPAEVLGLYNGVDPDPTSLVCKYRLSEGTGLATADESSHHYKGTITGASWTTTPIPIQRTSATVRSVATTRSVA